jgi:hypothetical protein
MKTEVHFFPPLNPGAIWFRPFLNGSSGMWKGLAAALIRALARVHRWNRMLGDGKYRSASEIAEAENVTRSFVNRLLRLTLLAPDIQEAIIDGRQPKGMQLEELTRTMPSGWAEQRESVAIGQSV